MDEVEQVFRAVTKRVNETWTDILQPFERLEHEWARWMGYSPERVVACASGTASLHLALEAFRLPPGSEVIIGEFNMVAVPRAIAMAGLVPVFVDCDNRLCMDERLAGEAYVQKTHAILFTHIYGRRCSMENLIRASVYNCYPAPFLIEDLSEAHGIKPHPQTDAACWSCYRNKIVAGAEGGIVAFRNPALAAYARRLRSLGFDDAHTFQHCPRGVNARLSNVHAELILASLANVEANLAERRRIEAMYDECCPDEWRMPPRQTCWVYDLKIPGITREKQQAIVRTLNEAGIAARMSFAPMTRQEEFRQCRFVGLGMADLMSAQVFYLPCTPGTVTQESVRLAFDIIRKAMV